MRLAIVLLAVGLSTACGSGGPDPADATWELDHAEADGALVSVWGSGPNDVWAAGGQAGEGERRQRQRRRPHRPPGAPGRGPGPLRSPPFAASGRRPPRTSGSPS